jgi:hypothetical protein
MKSNTKLCEEDASTLDWLSFPCVCHDVVVCFTLLEDPLPLSRAKINQGASVRKAEKARLAVGNYRFLVEVLRRN